MAARTIIISDVHGCLRELQALLQKLDAKSGYDRLIFVGDLLDRGPDSIGVLRLVQGLGAECVLGNHEEKYLRWCRYEAARKATGAANPMRPLSDSSLKIAESLDEFDLAWLASLPTFIELGAFDGEQYVVVHGGFEPSRSLSAQRVDKVIRCRWVDKHGNYMPITRGTSTPVEGPSMLDKPKGAVRWSQAWNRDLCVIYGHAVRSLKSPVFENNTYGIDTGVVYGGHLTALVLSNEGCHEVVQVPAFDTYATVLLDAA